MNEPAVLDDDRGVSTTLSYALNLAIAAILVSGLLFAAGSAVEDQRQTAAREELRVIGQRIAASIEQADRMVRVGTDTDLRLDILAPRGVAGLQYTIELNASTEDVVLTTENPDIEVRIDVTNQTDLEQSEIRGGELVIVYNSDGKLEVRVR